MSLNLPNHRTAASRPYGVDWTRFLAALPEADTIASSTWVVPSGLTNPGSEKGIIDARITWVRLTGGAIGETYEILNRITTAAGFVHEAALELYVEA